MSMTVQDEMAQALGLHRAGDLAEAAGRYQAILHRDPEHAEASCLLGMVRNQEGRFALAIELIGRAVALRPGVAAFHASLGLAWQAQGRLAEAAQEFGRVLELSPGDAAAHVNRGVVVRALGQKEPALEHFHRAVELNPGLAQGRTNLGELLLEIGRADDALVHCQAAVALQPQLAEAHVNLGNVQRALGHHLESGVSYVQAFGLNPGLAQAAAGLGLTFLHQDCWDEALTWLRRAVALEPESVEFLRYLAEAAAVRELYPEVRVCCEKMLEIDPGQAIAHNALGWLLQEDGRYAEAQEHYRTAIRLQPGFATAHYNLGMLHEVVGELSEAEAEYRTTLRIEPTHARSLARLATLLRNALPETDCVGLLRRLAATDLDAADRANLLFGLAEVRDARHEFAEAAECLHQANALALSELERRGRAYDLSDHRRFVEAAIAAYQPALFERLAGSGLDTPRPVFIFGLPRSGTTLIEQILASHPEVHGAGEVPLSRQSFEEIPRLLDRNDPPLSCLTNLDGPVVGELARRHEERLRQLDDGRSSRVVCKMPENYFYLGLLALLFPRAVLIHCRRDLRDVALSCWMTNFTDVRWANHFDHIADRFAGYRRVMGHWCSVLPSTIHEVSYEDTVADLEGVARRLMSLCGLGWEPVCLDFHRTRRPIRTASLTQVRRPLYRHAVGRWKHYERELAELFERIDSGGDA
jgi:tetratricopeptide (TPR) repeat protein